MPLSLLPLFAFSDYFLLAITFNDYLMIRMKEVMNMKKQYNKPNLIEMSNGKLAILMAVTGVATAVAVATYRKVAQRVAVNKFFKEVAEACNDVNSEQKEAAKEGKEKAGKEKAGKEKAGKEKAAKKPASELCEEESEERLAEAYKEAAEKAEAELTNKLCKRCISCKARLADNMCCEGYKCLDPVLKVVSPDCIGCFLNTYCVGNVDEEKNDRIEKGLDKLQEEVESCDGSNEKGEEKSGKNKSLLEIFNEIRAE